jgi:hypothetical protein
MKIIKTVSIFIIAAILFYSCGEKDLPDQDFIDFAKNIEQQINYENEIPIVNAFDYNEFEKRVLTGVDMSKNDMDRASEFIRGYTNPAKSILELVTGGANFRFIKFYRKNNEPHVIFRTYLNRGVSLEDWQLGVEDGKIMVYDAFAIVSGINWSDDCRQNLCNYLGLYTEEIINTNQLININYLVSEEDYNTADSLLYWVMPQMQENMYARTIEMRLSSLNRSYEDVQMLADKFTKTFPNEERISTFYLMQSSIRHGLIDETIKHIYTLIDLVGDDPVYYVYQSWVYQEANANQYALQALDSAIQYMPHIIDLYLNKISIYYLDYNYEKCVDILYRMDALFVPEEEDVSFFKTNYPLLNDYKPFNTWVEEKEKTNKKIQS